jgi:hypothetical protein
MKSVKEYKPNKPAQMTQQPPLVRPLSFLGKQDPSKKITFPGVKDLSLKELSSQVYLKMKTAPPHSVIYLPDRHIVLPGLTILHPLTIIGTPSTTLEIVNGNILIDFRNFKALNPAPQFTTANLLTPLGFQEIPAEQPKVVISEVTISFKMSYSRLRERLDEYNGKMASLKQDKKE